MQVPRLAWVIVGIVLAVLTATFLLGSNSAEVWRGIVRLLLQLQAMSDHQPVAAMAVYIVIYASLVALCLPLGPPMNVVGGALFGMWIGTACALVAIAAGCVTCFLVARSAFGALLGAQGGAMLARIRPRLERDGFMALLSLRIAPVVPSWLLNISAGLAGMRLGPFAVATVSGVAPATLIFNATGAGLAGVLDDGAPPALNLLLQPPILLPLLALSVLTLLPVLLRLRR